VSRSAPQQLPENHRLFAVSTANLRESSSACVSDFILVIGRPYSRITWRQRPPHSRARAWCSWLTNPHGAWRPSASNRHEPEARLQALLDQSAPGPRPRPRGTCPGPTPDRLPDRLPAARIAGAAPPGSIVVERRPQSRSMHDHLPMFEPTHSSRVRRRPRHAAPRRVAWPPGGKVIALLATDPRCIRSRPVSAPSSGCRSCSSSSRTAATTPESLGRCSACRPSRTEAASHRLLRPRAQPGCGQRSSSNARARRRAGRCIPRRRATLMVA